MTERPAIALVSWLDACFAKDYIPDAILLETVGFVVEDNDSRVVLAMERDPDESDKFRDYITIPRGYIQSVNYLCAQNAGHSLPVAWKPDTSAVDSGAVLTGLQASTIP